MNKLYSVHDHWTDINKKNDVDIESIDGVITGIKVNGEDYGGSEWQNIYDNTITTVLNSEGFYTTNIGVVIEADSIKVTFDGVEYICPKRSISEISTNYYGALTPLESGEENYDWSEFPFSIATGTDGESMIVTTQTAGTHTLKIDTPQSGGGSSDLSTAEVTVNIEDTARECELYYVEIIDSEEYAGVTPVRSYISGKILMPLYKGSCDMLIRGDIPSTVATTGNVTYEAFPSENTGYFTITGDCTITIS